MTDKQKPDLEHILVVAKQGMSQTSDFNYKNFHDAIAKQLIQENIVSPPTQPLMSYQPTAVSGEIEQLISEAFFYLFHRGFFVPKSDGQNAPPMTRFYVTKRGFEWFKSVEPLPDDSRSFMTFLNQSVPNLDPVIAGYVEEALTTYGRQAWFASAVMLGAAAEKAVYRLAESLEQAAQDQELKKRFRNAMLKRGLPALYDLVQETLDKSKNIDYSVQEGITQHLLSFFEAIRVQRNDAVHPKIGKVTPDGVRLTIAAFPKALAVMFRLIGWLEVNQI